MDMVYGLLASVWVSGIVTLLYSGYVVNGGLPKGRERLAYLWVATWPISLPIIWFMYNTGSDEE